MKRIAIFSIIILVCACTQKKEKTVKLINLDPGHFHAALVQKQMYEEVDPEVFVYALDGPELADYLKRVEGFNNRSDQPTSWNESVYRGDDFLEKMIEEKPGQVVVLSGNNARKTDYILQSVEAGLNVLADKPMVIFPGELPKLEKAFQIAREKGVLLYDIMTERYEITTMLQRELSMISEVFGEIIPGTPDNPAITKESVHHFFKYVAGNPIVRPGWFFDVKQQGDGIVDVSTHLADLIMWETFPGRIIKKEDIDMIAARRWTTDLVPEQFKRVTGLEKYPGYLDQYLDEDTLKVYSNGEMVYTIKGIHAKVSVTWNYEAPEGTGDIHYSIMRGTGCELEIRQGAEENFKPMLYVVAGDDADLQQFEAELKQALEEKIIPAYPGVELEKLNENRWLVKVPDSYKVGHEAHFIQVTEKYLEYLHNNNLPDWEIPNMITKYYTTMIALEKAVSKK
ncbi:MAG: oxidoreductase [Bacteroidales bacterium]|nr:oxidoreductase [Bacteroidales bacterium]